MQEVKHDSKVNQTNKSRTAIMPVRDLLSLINPILFTESRSESIDFQFIASHDLIGW